MQATNNNKTSFVHERKVIKTTSSHRHADIAELKCAPTPHVKATAAVQPADRRDQRLQLFGRFPAFDSARREKRIRQCQSHAQQHPSPDGRVWGERPSHAAANKMRLVTFAGRTEFRGSQTVQWVAMHGGRTARPAEHSTIKHPHNNHGNIRVCDRGCNGAPLSGGGSNRPPWLRTLLVQTIVRRPQHGRNEPRKEHFDAFSKSKNDRQCQILTWRFGAPLHGPPKQQQKHRPRNVNSSLLFSLFRLGPSKISLSSTQERPPPPVTQHFPLIIQKTTGKHGISTENAFVSRVFWLFRPSLIGDHLTAVGRPRV